jgi:MFS family permease
MTLSFIGIAFALTLYMQFVKGYTPFQTGVRFIPFAAGYMVGAGMSDIWVKRFGTKPVVMVAFIGMSIMGLITSFWTPATSFVEIGLILFGITFFMGNIAAPCATTLMEALSEEHAGVGSAMMSITRAVAGAIGIAGLGAVLNSVYTSSVEPTISSIATVPAEAANAAKESVGGAMIVAEQLPTNVGNVIREAAANSFMEGWQIMAIVMCGMAVMGFIFAHSFLPSREEVGEAEIDTEGSLKLDSTPA